MKKVSESEFFRSWDDDPRAIVHVDVSNGYPYTVKILDKGSGNLLGKISPVEGGSDDDCEYFVDENLIQNQSRH